MWQVRNMRSDYSSCTGVNLNERVTVIDSALSRAIITVDRRLDSARRELCYTPARMRFPQTLTLKRAATAESSSPAGESARSNSLRRSGERSSPAHGAQESLVVFLFSLSLFLSR